MVICLLTVLYLKSYTPPSNSFLFHKAVLSFPCLASGLLNINVASPHPESKDQALRFNTEVPDA